MAVKTTKASPPEKTYANGMDKLRDEMAGTKDEKIRLLGEGLTAMLQLHPEWEANISASGKSIAGALGAVKKNAVGGCSDPVRTTKSLIEYYGIPCEDPRRLALEVTAGMMGGDEDGGTTSSGTAQGAVPPSPKGEGFGEAPDPVDLFDLDALMGGV